LTAERLLWTRWLQPIHPNPLLLARWLLLWTSLLTGLLLLLRLLLRLSSARGPCCRRRLGVRLLQAAALLPVIGGLRPVLHQLLPCLLQPLHAPAQH